MIVVSMVMAFTTNSMSAANIKDNVNMVEHAIEVANSLVDNSKNETLYYNLDLNKNITRLVKYLELDGDRSNDLFDIQNTVKRSFNTMNYLDDDAKKSYFDNLIYYWRKNAYIAIVTANEGDRDYEEQRLQYRKYWCLCAQTMKNRGIITRDSNELIIYPMLEKKSTGFSLVAKK